MKVETFDKAKELLERIDHIEKVLIYFKDDDIIVYVPKGTIINTGTTGIGSRGYR